MKSRNVQSLGWPALLMAGLLTCGPALAAKPEWVNQGQGGQPVQKEQNKAAPKAAPVAPGRYFVDQQRDVARAYYGKQYSAKRCPPG